MKALRRRNSQVFESLEINSGTEKKEIKQEMGMKVEKQQKQKSPMLYQFLFWS